MDSAHSLALSGVRSIKDKVAEVLVYQCMLKMRWPIVYTSQCMYLLDSLI